MAVQRWKFGSYAFTYNPKSDERTIKATTQETISVTGTISNPNLFFDKDLSIEFDLYDKPTYYETNAIKTFSANLYVSISEKRSTGELYCLKAGAVDIVNSTTGATIATKTYSFTGTPLAITHMDNKLAIIFRETGSTGSLYVTDENCAQISKYNITDNDYLNILSMTWDFSNSVYILNKYGKIFTVNTTNGISSLLKQYDDFATNQSGTISAYKGIHIYAGFVGFLKNNVLTYVDSNLDPIYGNDVPTRVDIGSVAGFSCGNFTSNCFALSSTKIIKIYPNTCGIDIERIKKEMSNGLVLITDDKNNSFYAIVNDMKVNRLRNKQDARYVVSLSGTII